MRKVKSGDRTDSINSLLYFAIRHMPKECKVTVNNGVCQFLLVLFIDGPYLDWFLPFKEAMLMMLCQFLFSAFFISDTHPMSLSLEMCACFNLCFSHLIDALRPEMDFTMNPLKVMQYVMSKASCSLQQRYGLNRNLVLSEGQAMDSNTLKG